MGSTKQITLVWRWIRLTGIYGFSSERGNRSAEVLRLSTSPECWRVRRLVDGQVLPDDATYDEWPTVFGAQRAASSHLLAETA